MAALLLHGRNVSGFRRRGSHATVFGYLFYHHRRGSARLGACHLDSCGVSISGKTLQACHWRVLPVLAQCLEVEHFPETLLIIEQSLHCDRRRCSFRWQPVRSSGPQGDHPRLSRPYSGCILDDGCGANFCSLPHWRYLLRCSDRYPHHVGHFSCVGAGSDAQARCDDRIHFSGHHSFRTRQHVWPIDVSRALAKRGMTYSSEASLTFPRPVPCTTGDTSSSCSV